MSIQRYVSEELTHFVGRELSKEEQYATLVDKILKTGWLLSDPRVYTPTQPKELLETKSWTYTYHPSAPIDEMYLHQVVCFCDIPITDLEIHMRKYSRFGLSFLKPFLAKKGANPVLYMAKNSRSLPVGAHDTEKIIGRHDLLRANITQCHELMQALMSADESRLAQAAKTGERPLGMSDEEWQWLKTFLWPRVKSFRDFLDLYLFSFIKYFDDSTSDEDPANVYMEREWRVLGNVNFALSDVRRVFLPEEFAERFRADLPEYTGQLTFSGEVD
jgi:Putative abortive phage resistance protein AbiGi, antitoxin